MEFKLGDCVKIIDENRVFKVCGFTGKGSMVIPEGWLIDQDGFSINPKFCEKYEGAISAIPL
tara:strand:+ start:1857 stop:2042 length:186 start_codon:yes stop_codon:yes gene_type:complete